VASTDATALPVKGQAYRLTFPIWDADGDLVTGAAGLDSEVSKDAGTFVDCTNEATEIATASGMYYLDLTAAEMTADTVAIIVKTSTSGAKTTPIVLYPQEAADIKVSVSHWNGTAVPAEHTAGYPIATIKDGTGTGEIDTASGVVLARDHAGAALATASAVAALPSATAIAAAVWDYLTSAATTVGSLGKLLVDRIDAAVSSRSTYAGTDTAGTTTLLSRLTGTRAGYLDNLSSAPPSAATVASQVRTELTAELARIDVATSSRATPAQVNAELLDVLTVDTYAEPGKVAPAATTSLALMVRFLYKAWRNKKAQTSGQYSLYADDGVTVDQQASVSADGTTTTVGEIGAGS
jgi:hypothetical protein